MQIKLTDGNWVEGKIQIMPWGELNDYMTETGIWLHDAHHSVGAETLPLGKRVFVPYSNILFVIVEE